MSGRNIHTVALITSMLTVFLLSGCASNIPEVVGLQPSDRRLAASRVNTVLKTYERKQLHDIIPMIASSFEGNRSNFETKLNDHLGQFDLIEYELFVDNMKIVNNQVNVEFHWTKRWRDIDKRTFTSTTGETKFVMRKQNDKFYLHAIRGQNPFY